MHPKITMTEMRIIAYPGIRGNFLGCLVGLGVEGFLYRAHEKGDLELGFTDDGYNYLIYLREIKNASGGSAFYYNSKARLDQVPRDVKVKFGTWLLLTALYGLLVDFLFVQIASKKIKLSDLLNA